MSDEQLTPEQQDIQDDAAFSAGFESTGAIEPKADTKEQTAPVDAPEAAQDEPKTDAVETPPEPPKAEDPWANVPDVVKSHIEKLEIHNKQLDRDVKAAIGRAAAVQAAFDSAKAAAATGDKAPTQTQITEAATAGGEKWAAIKKDFPEWADGFEERLAQLAPPKLDEEALQKRVSDSITPTLREQLRAELRDEAIREAREFARVDAKHPGWEEIVKEPAFGQWAASQPPEVQALASSNKASDAIRMLDLYTAQRKQAETKSKQKERLTGAVPVKGSSVGGPSVLDDEAAFSAGFNS